MTQRVPLAGSAADHTGLRYLGGAEPCDVVEATIVLRDTPSTTAADLLSGTYDPTARTPATVDAGVLDAVVSFATTHGLTIVESNRSERRVVVRGTASVISTAFGVPLAFYESADGRRYRSYEGPIILPADVASSILAVLGLDQRPVGHPRQGC